MVQDPVRIEDLFPSATDLFRRRPRRLRMFAWVVAGALAALLGRHLLNSADHSI